MWPIGPRRRLFGTQFAALARMVVVNGGPGVVIRAQHQPTIVAGFTIADGRIAAIDLIADPVKLGGLTL